MLSEPNASCCELFWQLADSTPMLYGMNFRGVRSVKHTTTWGDFSRAVTPVGSPQLEGKAQEFKNFAITV